MFRKQHHKHIIIIVSLLVGLVALALPSIMPTVTADTAQLMARQEVAQALDQAGDSGQYRYQTTVVQTHYPTLLLENVGRSARVETIELNGTVDVPADSMMLQMKVPNSPELQIRIEGGRGYGRLTAEDEWTEVELATDLFAPGGDPMGFLASAENIRLAEGSLTDSVSPLCPFATRDAGMLERPFLAHQPLRRHRYPAQRPPHVLRPHRTNLRRAASRRARRANPPPHHFGQPNAP